MNVSNIRLGHATNSSSSHSIILLNRRQEDYDCYGNEFGWGCFTLGSRAAKAEYFAQAVYHHYKKTLDEVDAAALTNAAFPGYVQCSRSTLNSGYIDHQSMPTFPTPFGSETLQSHLWEWITKNIIENYYVAVLGGNDNDGTHPMRHDGPDVHVPWSQEGYPTKFRWDPQGYITTFDPATGDRLRFSNFPVKYATSPELLDVKITDYCDKGCWFCYQDSSPDGAHASAEALYSIAYMMGELGIFEAALGGGEPTSHPKFDSILRNFKAEGVTPSFSTRSLAWLSDKKIVEAVTECAGAVAFSVENAEEADLWFGAAADVKIPHPCIHVILGATSPEELNNILDVSYRRWGTRVVLLAFKPEGRAVNMLPPHDVDACWNVVANHRQLERGNIAVDSYLVPFVPEKIKDADPRTYEVSDGRFSMYIDAVKMTAAKDSHQPKEAHIQLSSYRLQDVWEQIRES